MTSRPPKTDKHGKGVVAGAKTVSIDGRHLTLAQIEAIASKRVPVRVSTAGRVRAKAAHDNRLNTAKRRLVYGHSTGVGSNKDTPVIAEAVADHGLRLLKSHAAGAGPLVESELARAMMVVRLNQLAAGGSGVHPRLLDALAQALGKNLAPPIKRFGAIGTSDLPALATTALCIMGERAWTGGTMLPYPFDGSDAMAFMSSSAATLGEAALAVRYNARLLHAGLAIAALTHIAMGGSPEAYSEGVQAAKPHDGQGDAARELRSLLDADFGRLGRRIQDPYGLRALPQVQGTAIDAAAEVERTLLVEVNAASENPLVSSSTDNVYHNGNFHTMSVSLALDKLRAALFSAASLSVARIGGLMAPGNTGLRPFLAEGPAASSGVLIMEYVAHSALAELRHLALPDSLGSAVLSHGVEEHASFATQSAWHTTEMVPVYETILACELLAALRAMHQQKVVPAGDELRSMFKRAQMELKQNEENLEIEAAITALTGFIHQMGRM